jgi:hypothetical protein
MDVLENYPIVLKDYVVDMFQKIGVVGYLLTTLVLQPKLWWNDQIICS